MCGIAGLYIRRPENLAHIDLSQVSRELMFAIDSRGGDACGYAAVDMDGIMQEQKAACSALKFELEMQPMPRNLRTLLLHTRFATQGHQAFPENNHPVRSGPIRVIHNGHISNDTAFFGDEVGIERLGRVDSEAIAAAIRKVGWENAKEALEQLEGSFAIAAISEDHPDELILARGNSSPLVVAIRPSFVMWASTMSAIQYTWETCVGTSPDTKHLEYFKEGEIVHISSEGVKRSTFEPKRSKWVWSSRSQGWGDEDGYLGGRFGTGGNHQATGTYTYWMNGQKIEYDRATQTERVVEDARADLYNRPTDTAAQFPLRTWISDHLKGSNRQLDAAAPFCAECGCDTEEELNDVSGVWYCADCLDFLCDLAAADAMPSQPVREREGVDDSNTFIRCPDCFDYYNLKDMVEDKGEYICGDCNHIQNMLSDIGGEG